MRWHEMRWLGRPLKNTELSAMLVKPVRDELFLRASSSLEGGETVAAKVNIWPTTDGTQTYCVQVMIDWY